MSGVQRTPGGAVQWVGTRLFVIRPGRTAMSSRIAPHSFLLLLSALLGACGGNPSRPIPVAPPRAVGDAGAYVPSEGSVAPEQVTNREVIFRATMDVTVEDPMGAA